MDNNHLSNYFYRVSEFVGTLESKGKEPKSFDFDRDFNTHPLIKARKEALAYYGNRNIKFSLDGKDKDFFNHKFASPEEVIINESYSYSLNLAFIEDHGFDTDLWYNFLLGEDEEMIADGQNEEKKYYQR